MPAVTVYCYLFSLGFYVAGSLKSRALEKAMSGQLAPYDFTFDAALATGCFVLTIFLVIIGSYFLFLKYLLAQKRLRRRGTGTRLKVNLPKAAHHNVRRAG